MNLFSSKIYSSSPVESSFRHIMHVKHFKWNTLFLARLTRSLGDIPKEHPAHFVPNLLKHNIRYIKSRLWRWFYMVHIKMGGLSRPTVWLAQLLIGTMWILCMHIYTYRNEHYLYQKKFSMFSCILNFVDMPMVLSTYKFKFGT